MINEGLFRLQQATGSSQVLSSTIASEPLVFIKDATLATQSGGRLATNEQATFFDIVFNPQTNTFDSVEISERRITFGDWDETDAAANVARLDEVPREIAFVWAGAEPITALIPLQVGYWDSFLQLSGWTQERPDDITFFDVTPDAEWFYLQSAPFADAAGTLSPEDDFATMWKLIIQNQFADPAAPVDPANPINDEALIPKLASVDQFFALLGTGDRNDPGTLGPEVA